MNAQTETKAAAHVAATAACKRLQVQPVLMHARHSVAYAYAMGVLAASAVAVPAGTLERMCVDCLVEMFE